MTPKPDTKSGRALSTTRQKCITRNERDRLDRGCSLRDFLRRRVIAMALDAQGGLWYAHLESEIDMATKLEEIEKAALDLPAAERAQLVTHLVASLGEEADAEIELAWVDEAERRYQEAVKDPSAVEPASAAFQRARDALR